MRACKIFRNTIPTSHFSGLQKIVACSQPYIPCSAFLYLQFLAPCHPNILLDFYTNRVQNSIQCSSHLIKSIPYVVQGQEDESTFWSGYTTIEWRIV